MSVLRNYGRRQYVPAVLVHLFLFATFATAQPRTASQANPSWGQAIDVPSNHSSRGDTAAFDQKAPPRRFAPSQSPLNPNRQQSINRGSKFQLEDTRGHVSPRRPTRTARPTTRTAQLNKPQPPGSAIRPKSQDAQAAVYSEVPKFNAVKQVDWQQQNSCGCACPCQGKACYSSQCSHCAERWSLFPQSKRIQLGGWIQQGVTFNFNAPSDRSNTRVFFNDRSNDYLLNQAYFHAAVPVCNDGSHWDVGGRLDVNYGSDSRFITVPGLERHRDRTAKWNGENALYGLAVPQAYFEVAAPWMNGVSLKAGHFYSTMGYERVAAPDNFFYSHSYSLIFGEPFTFTGALATIKPSKTWKFIAGYTGGWDVWDSTSNEWGVLAGVRWSTPNGRTSVGLQVYSGADVTSVRVGNALVDEGRTAWTLVFKHCLTERLLYVFQHDFGQQTDGRIVATIPTSMISFGPAKWYSINQYLFYEIHKQLSSGLRVEWFRDQDNSRAGVPVVFNPGGPVFNGGNYLEITAGLNWRPHPNIIVRPELRWDWSDLRGNPNVPGGNSAVRAFVNGRRANQFIAALDLIIHY